VPKSSTASEKPFRRSRVRMSSAATGSAATDVSVTSKVTRAGVRAVPARCSITASGKAMSVSAAGGRFTDTLRFHGVENAAACCAVFSITRHVSGSASPAASATSTNISGGIRPVAGSCHRTSASTPITSPVRTDTCG
jgi:hypothetical protein